ncbi:MAG: hypothetical protein H6Q08_1453 [Acidobacteria bacterium]|jgi:hypothetical protein|nr:hypothetical protein [Acidobacteriota bacterium]
MTFDLEVMLRASDQVFAERIDHDREPEEWTDADVEAALRKILRAIDRISNPDAPDDRPISLKGLSWIVQPYLDGVVLAFEIHSASAVAGPFAVPQDRLEQMVARVLGGVTPSSQVVH